MPPINYYLVPLFYGNFLLMRLFRSMCSILLRGYPLKNFRFFCNNTRPYFRVIFHNKEFKGFLERFYLGFHIEFVLKECVVYAGSYQNENQWRDFFVRDHQLWLQALCVFGISFICTRKEFLAILSVFRVSADLIHKSVFLAVVFCRPVGDLVNKPS